MPPSEAYLIVEQPESMLTSMQLDAWLFHLRLERPVVRIYALDKPAVTLGRFQDPLKDLDCELLRSWQIPWVRRVTGGRSLWHDGGVTYTVVAPCQNLPSSVVESYRVLSAPVFSALKNLEPDVQWPATCKGQPMAGAACFTEQDVETVTYLGRKVVGSAQRRSRTHVLQHGEISVSRPSVSAPHSVFTGTLEQAYESRVGYLQHLSVSQVLASLKEQFQAVFGKLMPLDPWSLGFSNETERTR